MRTDDALSARGNPGLRPILTAELPALPKRRRALARAAMLAVGGLVEVEEPERLAALPEPAIFALNHSNSFEAFAVPLALIWHRGGRPVHFLADWMYLHLPLVGWLLRQAEPIPVYTKPQRWRLMESHRREQARRRPVLDATLDRLETGASVGLFPEGTRNRDPERLLRGRGGLGELVLRSEAPVIPTGIRYPARERLGRVPIAGRIHLHLGAPLDFQDERARASRCSGGERRALVRRIVARVMAELAVLSGKTYENDFTLLEGGSHAKRRHGPEGRHPGGPAARPVGDRSRLSTGEAVDPEPRVRDARRSGGAAGSVLVPGVGGR
jgi:1-acyl-sn-glycerol-3-phosphate acyltransferase